MTTRMVGESGNLWKEGDSTDGTSAAGRVAELRAEIERHNRLYYDEAAPVVSDRDYDLLAEELADLERRHPELADASSPTQKVGGTAAATFDQIVHEVPMLSIGNSYDAGELREFDARVKKGLGLPPDQAVEYVVELKIDGVAVAVRYDAGRISYGATRGDGTRGEVITDNLLTISDIPKHLPKACSGSESALEVRGEIYMTTAEFEKLNDEIIGAGGERYANPRNLAAGSLKQKDAAITRKRPLRMFAYALGVVSPDLAPHVPPTHAQFLDWLASLGFPVNPERTLCGSIDAVLAEVEKWEPLRAKLPYGTDGLVVKLNRRDWWERLGFRSKSPRFMTAYKFSAEQAITVLRDIIFQVGRLGTITPVAVLDPVFLAGTTVSRATLHNADELARLGILLGDRVMVEKAGDVIPRVVRVVENLRTGEERPYVFPTHCPACGAELKRAEEEVAWRCENVSCPAQVRERLLHYASRHAMDVEGLGDVLVSQLLEKKLIAGIADLYRLNADDVAALERSGKKKAQNLMAELEASKTRPLHSFLFGLGIPHVGTSAARLLARRFPDVESISSAPVETLETVEGVGAIMAQSIRAFFTTEENCALLSELKSLGLAPTNPLYRPDQATTAETGGTEVSGGQGALAGMTVVFTGSMELLTRDEARERAEAAGAKVSASVSKKTSLVVAGEEAGSKLEKANTLGVRVVTEKEFLDLLNETGS